MFDRLERLEQVLYEWDPYPRTQADPRCEGTEGEGGMMKKVIAGLIVGLALGSPAPCELVG